MAEVGGDGEPVFLFAGELVGEVETAIHFAGVAAGAAMIAHVDAGGDCVCAADVGEVDFGGGEDEVGPGGDGLPEGVVAVDGHDGEGMIVTGDLIEVGREADVARFEGGGDGGEDIAFAEVIDGSLHVEHGVAAGSEDVVGGEAAVIAIDAVGLKTTGGFEGPVLAVFTVFEPGPAAEEAVLFGKVVIEAIGEGAVAPVVGLGDTEVVVEGLEVGGGGGIVGVGEELGVGSVGGAYDAGGGKNVAGDGIANEVAGAGGIGTDGERIVELIARADGEEVREIAAAVGE